jgi:tripartite-type tricarboxylate transporter receptor subunit TctC
MMLFRKLGAMLSVALPALCTLPAAAGDWPAKPITVLAPFSAGGTVDIVARIVSNKLSRELGENIVVENHTGAGGTLATGALAHAAPNGYTLMVHHMGLAFNASLYDKLSYDTVRDIMPIAYIGATPNVLVTTNGFPAKTVAEFLEFAKSKPGDLNYGSGGIGSAGHLPMAVLESTAHIKLVHVPYRGAAPALSDLMSGHIQIMLQTIPAVMPYIQAGRVRPLATSGRVRSSALPDLPTLDEAGIKGFDYSPWYGFFAPAGTPLPIVNKLHAAINKVLSDPEILSRLGQQGLEVQTMTREQFARIVAADIAKWGTTIKTLGIKAE